MSICSRASNAIPIVFVALLTAVATAGTGAANAPKYDVSTEAKMKVTVEEFKLPAKGSEREVAHMMVKSGDDTFDIYLCPKAFLDDMGANFAKGDEVTITGSKIKQDGTDVILARELVKGTDTLLLRDGKGKPVWSQH